MSKPLFQRIAIRRPSSSDERANLRIKEQICQRLAEELVEFIDPQIEYPCDPAFELDLMLCRTKDYRKVFFGELK